MQFWIIIERAAAIILQLLTDRPGDHVAQRIKIEMKIECHIVIKPETFVINGVVTNQAKTEGDDSARFAPNEKACSLRHRLSDSAEKFLRENFEFHGRALVDLEI